MTRVLNAGPGPAPASLPNGSVGNACCYDSAHARRVYEATR